jgi:hypothetical protein
VLVRVQSPVRLGPHSEPQPDIALLRRSEDYYRSAHPTARDVFLVVVSGRRTVRWVEEFLFADRRAREAGTPRGLDRQ